MGIRETLNKNPAISIGVLAGVILLAVIWIFMSLRDEPMGPMITKAYYTIDDGATFFEDEYDKLAPFQKDGKEAVRAHVFDCNGKRFVGFMEKLTPAAKAELEKMGSGDRDRIVRARIEVEQGGRLFKKPKGNNWIPSSSPQASAVMEPPKCDGAVAHEVLPEPE